MGTSKRQSQSYIGGLVQARRKSSVLAMELRLSYTNPLTIYPLNKFEILVRHNCRKKIRFNALDLLQWRQKFP